MTQEQHDFMVLADNTRPPVHYERQTFRVVDADERGVLDVRMWTHGVRDHELAHTIGRTMANMLNDYFKNSR